MLLQTSIYSSACKSLISAFDMTGPGEWSKCNNKWRVVSSNPIASEDTKAVITNQKSLSERFWRRLTTMIFKVWFPSGIGAVDPQMPGEYNILLRQRLAG